MFTNTYILGLATFFTVTSFLMVTLRGVVYGQTAGERQVNKEYRENAKARNEVDFHPVSKLIIYLIYIFPPPRNLSTHMTAGSYYQ